MAPTEAVTFGIRKARALCKEWQSILGLSDWRVTVHIVRATEMSNTDADGECQYVLPRKKATVWLRSSLDRHDSDEVDMEADLVHELLHIPFAPFFISESENPHLNLAMEQVIDGLAEAMVKLARGE